MHLINYSDYALWGTRVTISLPDFRLTPPDRFLLIFTLHLNHTQLSPFRLKSKLDHIETLDCAVDKAWPRCLANLANVMAQRVLILDVNDPKFRTTGRHINYPNIHTYLRAKIQNHQIKVLSNSLARILEPCI